MGELDINEVNMRGIMAEEFHRRWGDVKPLVKKALHATDSHLDFDPEDILVKINDREFQAWGIFEEDEIISIILTQIAEYPKRNVLEIFLVSGDELNAWVHGAHEVMFAYAKTHGCGGMISLSSPSFACSPV